MSSKMFCDLCGREITNTNSRSVFGVAIVDMRDFDSGIMRCEEVCEDCARKVGNYCMTLKENHND